jgi:hypothetical protein
VIVAYSALAEGADRIVAEAVLGTESGRLEVFLPSPIDKYLRTFTNVESKEQFNTLLGRATSVTKTPTRTSQEESYELAGRMVVDRSDVLLALWDGKPSGGPGGTAEIVAYALHKRVPVVVIPPDLGKFREDWGEGPVSDDYFAACQVYRSGWSAQDREQQLPLKLTSDSHQALDQYNQLTAGHSGQEDEHFRQAEVRERAKLPPSTGRNWDFEDLADWILPYFVRADYVALYYQRWYSGFTLLEFAASAGAVFAVAFAAEFQGKLVEVEVFLLLLVVAVVLIGRRLRFNRRWLSSRFLAERFRSALYLKAAGLGAWHATDARGPGPVESGNEWLERAHSYVWAKHKQIAVTEKHSNDLRDLLIAYWIAPQVDYHEHQYSERSRKAKRLTRISVALFIVTACIAVVHLTLHLGGWERWVIALSLALPGSGAAVAGISAHRQYQWSSTVHRSMAGQLRDLEEKMAHARRLKEIQGLATEAAAAMAQETRDWLGIMRFTNFELSA